MAGRAFIDVDIVADSTSVYRMLDHLDTCFSPAGQTAFMEMRVTPYLRERAKGRFLSEGDDASGGKWAPLRPDTVRIRETSGFGGKHPINVRTGEMERYVTNGAGTVTVGPGLTTLVYPDAQGPGGALKKKIRTAQTGEGASAKRKVLAVDESDLMHVTSQLAFFIQNPGGIFSGR